MYKDIKEYVKTYDSCQLRERLSKNKELHLIPPHSPFYQLKINFIESLHIAP